MDHRFGKVVWGPSGTRVLTSDANWKKPLKWNREAESRRKLHERHPELEPYERPRVFCASLADVFEDWDSPIFDHKGNRLATFGGGFRPALEGDDFCIATMDDVRQRLFALIGETPELDYLLLTKRPENIRRMWPRLGFPDAGVPGTLGRRLWLDNVWLGTSVENQEYADTRIPELLACRGLSPVLFLSCEPLLGPIDLRPKAPDTYAILGRYYHSGHFDPTGSGPTLDRVLNCFPRIDLVIVGSESGPERRETRLDWVRGLRDQCQAAGVAFWVKQLAIDGKCVSDLNAFPPDLRIREAPSCLECNWESYRR